MNLGTIKAGEEKEVEYELRITEVNIDRKALPAKDNKLVEPQIIAVNKVNVIANKMQKAVESNEYKLQLEEGKLSLNLSTDKASDYILSKGDTLTYTARIEDVSNIEKLEKLQLAVNIPDGIEIQKTQTKNNVENQDDSKVDIQTNNNTVTFNLDNYNIEDSMDFIVETKVGNAERNSWCYCKSKSNKCRRTYFDVISNKVQL